MRRQEEPPVDGELHGRDRREADRVALGRAGERGIVAAIASGISSERQAARVATRSSSQAAPEREQPVVFGRQRDVVDPQPAQLAGDRLAPLALELGEPLAHAPPARCRPRSVSPVSGSTSARCPTAGSSASRGSAISTASTACRTRSEPSGRSQPCCSRKSEITTTRPGWRASRPTRRRAPAMPSGSCWPSGATPSASIRRSATIPGLEPRGGSTRGAVGAERDQPDAAGPADAEPPEHERDALGDVGLQPQRRCRTPSTARRRARSTSSARARARAGARAAVPVRAVAAGSMWRTSSPISYGRSWASSVPSADPGGPPVARQHPRDQPADRDVERLDQRLRHRTRALPGRGRL